MSWHSYGVLPGVRRRWSHDDPDRLGPMARVDDPHHYLDRAFEYYVTGRFAALNNLQVAPNLFHHAVELLAKFQLLRRVPDAQLPEEVKKLKQKPYGHDLRTLWSDFKASVTTSGLDRFDSVVADLNSVKDRGISLLSIIEIPHVARHPDGGLTTAWSLASPPRR